MSIFPLPVFEADADPHHREAMTDREIYERLEVPDSLVIKFGYMKLVAELPYSGDVKPGCGTKLVARTHRGTELVEMLTTTCENAGCSKSITRKEMLEFIENSGGKDFPFHDQGKVIRVATVEDMNRMSELDSNKREWIRKARAKIRELQLDMKLVEVEPILGMEILTLYYMAEERVDFRQLVRELAGEFSTRIEMRQVGARDEARLVADYERCGQHCCCKNFLKVLKPVSMRAAKVQKATLDPLKISGRCGRLMCCLRYEDQTYKELKASLPHRKTRVGTSEGPGIVMDTRILAQLVLVKLEHDNKEIAVPVEELMDPATCPKPGEAPAETSDPMRGLSGRQVEERTDDTPRGKRGQRHRSRREKQDHHRKRSQTLEGDAGSDARGPVTKDADDDARSPDADDGGKPDGNERKGRRPRGKGKGTGKGKRRPRGQKRKQRGPDIPPGRRKRRRRGGKKKRGGGDSGG